MRPYERNPVLKKKINDSKEFVRRNQTTILTTALAVTSTLVVLQRIGLKQHNDFLKEKNLHDEFYGQID